MGYASYKESIDERRPGQPVAAARSARSSALDSPAAPDAALRVRSANDRALAEIAARQLALLRDLCDRLGLRLGTNGVLPAGQHDVLERRRAELAERETLATELRAAKKTNERLERVVADLKQQVGDRRAEHRKAVDQVKSLERELSDRKRETRSVAAERAQLETLGSQLDDCRSACDRLRTVRDRLGEALRNSERRLVSKMR